MSYTFEYEGKQITSRVPEAKFLQRIRRTTGQKWTVERAASEPHHNKTTAGRRAAKNPESNTHVVFASRGIFGAQK